MNESGKIEVNWLRYLDEAKVWDLWRMEGELKPHQAAALLTNWMATFETSLSPVSRTDFWTLRVAMFYTSVRWANYQLRHEWGEPAEYIAWGDFLRCVRDIPEEKGLIFFPGKFRTLPTPSQVESVWLGLESTRQEKPVSALIFEPKENIAVLEDDKVVFDDRTRAWAYALLPVNMMTMFPPIPNGMKADDFYQERYAEIRLATRGGVKIGVGISKYRQEITVLCQTLGIDVIDTSIESEMGTNMAMWDKDTTDFDGVSANASLADTLILTYLRHMGQIKSDTP